MFNPPPAHGISDSPHDKARLMPVFDGEYPAARNLVQPRHRQAPSFSHERRTHGEATRNDEEPLN